MAASSKLGTVAPISAVERQALARFTNDAGDNVAIEVHPAATSLTVVLARKPRKSLKPAAFAAGPHRTQVNP